MSNGLDLPAPVIELENSYGAVAGEALGAERTFDFSKIGQGILGPGSEGGES